MSVRFGQAKYTKTKEHVILLEYACSHCGKYSGKTPYTFRAVCTQDYGKLLNMINGGVPSVPQEDLPVIDRTLDIQIALQMAGVFSQEKLGTYMGFLDHCPHCRKKVRWEPRRKFPFVQTVPLSQEERPIIHWNLNEIDSSLHPFICNLNEDCGDSKPKAKAKILVGRRAKVAFDYAAPGVSEVLIPGLMGEAYAEVLPFQEDKPEGSPDLMEGERAYGYIGAGESWWIIALEGKVISKLRQS